jgi:tRNA (cmo5U34)-methyltransferase
MSRDEIFNSAETRGSDFEFNEEVAQVFDDMLERSIPFYLEQQQLIQQIAARFYLPGTRVYDLGSSTANTLLGLAPSLGDEAELVGYDNSEPMLERAREKAAQAGVGKQMHFRFADLNADLSSYDLSNASVVTLCWTLQFVRPLRRDHLIRWIYDGLVDGGVLIATEKTLTNDSDMNRFFIDFYYEYKRRHGYSEEEILRKREALENVLVPYRIDENFDLFRRNGFSTVETFFQWYNFTGMLCVKKNPTG